MMYTGKAHWYFSSLPTLPFVLAVAGKGSRQALLDDPHLLAGLNVHAGEITCPPVAEALGVNCLAAREALAGRA